MVEWNVFVSVSPRFPRRRETRLPPRLPSPRPLQWGGGLNSVCEGTARWTQRRASATARYSYIIFTCIVLSSLQLVVHGARGCPEKVYRLQDQHDQVLRPYSDIISCLKVPRAGFDGVPVRWHHRLPVRTPNLNVFFLNIKIQPLGKLRRLYNYVGTMAPPTPGANASPPLSLSL